MVRRPVNKRVTQLITVLTQKNMIYYLLALPHLCLNDKNKVFKTVIIIQKRPKMTFFSRDVSASIFRRFTRLFTFFVASSSRAEKVAADDSNRPQTVPSDPKVNT